MFLFISSFPSLSLYQSMYQTWFWFKAAKSMLSCEATLCFFPSLLTFFTRLLILKPYHVFSPQQNLCFSSAQTFAGNQPSIQYRFSCRGWLSSKYPCRCLRESYILKLLLLVVLFLYYYGFKSCSMYHHFAYFSATDFSSPPSPFQSRLYTSLLGAPRFYWSTEEFRWHP